MRPLPEFAAVGACSKSNQQLTALITLKLRWKLVVCVSVSLDDADAADKIADCTAPEFLRRRVVGKEANLASWSTLSVSKHTIVVQVLPGIRCAILQEVALTLGRVSHSG